MVSAGPLVTTAGRISDKSCRLDPENGPRIAFERMRQVVGQPLSHRRCVNYYVVWMPFFKYPNKSRTTP